MRFNENIAISTSKVLLVPYDAHHVPRYHEWMEDAAIREATASERLTLAEEYENQTSWREAGDKLTFIVCEALPPPRSDDDHHHQHLDQPQRLGTAAVVAGEADGPARMVGDINLFLTPWEDDSEDDEGELRTDRGGKGTGIEDTDTRGNENEKRKRYYCGAEVDVMIADPRHRGKGLGRAAVATFLLFVRRNLDAVLREYAEAGAGAGAGTPVLRGLVAKIHQSNAGSIALFRGLGFRQRGEVNYFGEVHMVLEGFGEEEKEKDGSAWVAAVKGDGFEELEYDRSRLMV
ncbi:GNAT domain-containing protein [Hypoxylon sp. NC1633]|nr:GNAT domain-containing protein [Hypoxylon sp. NC1633]